MPKRRFDGSVEVKSPCSESWDEMAGNDKVRFCSHCAKEVNDISKLTRREAMMLVRKSNGRLCVRYEVRPQTRRPVFASRIGSIARNAGIAAGVITASIAMAEAAYAQGGAGTFETVSVEQTEKTSSAASGISGYVTDSSGAAIPFAVVSVSNLDTFEYKSVNASGEGFYEFRDLAPGNYAIKFEAGGFDMKQVEKISISEASSVRRDARLEVQQLAATVEVKGDGEVEGFIGLVVGDISVVDTNGARPNDLVSAVLNEDKEEVENLIRNGARLNVRDKTVEGMTPLHAAIETGNIEIMQMLLAYGAKPNARDFQKRTPLMMLDEDAEPEMVRILLSYGANIRLTDAGRNTVLHHFAAFDEPEMMKFLIQYGADPNARNKQGRTPLMFAAENDNAEALRALLESGADIRAITKKKQTAWDLAGGDDARGVLETFGLIGGSRP